MFRWLCHHTNCRWVRACTWATANGNKPYSKRRRRRTKDFVRFVRVELVFFWRNLFEILLILLLHMVDKMKRKSGDRASQCLRTVLAFFSVGIGAVIIGIWDANVTVLHKIACFSVGTVDFFRRQHFFAAEYCPRNHGTYFERGNSRFVRDEQWIYVTDDVEHICSETCSHLQWSAHRWTKSETPLHVPYFIASCRC